MKKTIMLVVAAVALSLGSSAFAGTANPTTVGKSADVTYKVAAKLKDPQKFHDKLVEVQAVQEKLSPLIAELRILSYEVSGSGDAENLQRVLDVSIHDSDNLLAIINKFKFREPK